MPFLFHFFNSLEEALDFLFFEKYPRFLSTLSPYSFFFLKYITFLIIQACEPLNPQLIDYDKNQFSYLVKFIDYEADIFDPNIVYKADTIN